MALVLCNIAAADERPNVLFIIADDLRVELGCYGSEHVISPRIDKLAAQGTLFENAYCQQPVCNPSRASVLTGMRPDKLRVWDLHTHFRENNPDLITLPQLFKEHGYHTQGIGKIFHNWRQDEWKGDSASWSVPEVMHYGKHQDDTPRVSGNIPPNLASGINGIECRDVPDTAYYDGRIAKMAIETLRDMQEGKNSFFLAVGFWKPHTPFNAPKRYWDLYERDKIPIPTHLDPPQDVPAIALTDAWFNGRENPELLREMHHGHLAAISYLDAQVGMLINELEVLGLRENTIIVFWSDHGLHIGEHGLTGKTTNFELDAAVPLIITTPKYTGGQRTDALVELLDLYPTLAELCGLQSPAGLDGISMVPLLNDPQSSIRNAALTQTPRPNYPKGEIPHTMGYSIRTDRYRYTEWRDFNTGVIKDRELYDHRVDPLETRNVSDRPDSTHLVTTLADKLENILRY